MTIVAETFGHRPPKAYAYRHGELPAVNPTLMLGLELEVEAVRWPNGDIINDCDRLGFRVHDDGSLRGVNNLPAYEFISKPIESRHALHALTEFYKKAQFSEENQNFSDRTSVHVHVNCLDLEWETLACVALLYTIMEAPLFGFVNADPKQPEGHYRDTNIYCIPWAQCRDHYGLVANFLSNPTTQLARWQKYTALNLLPLTTQGTVEFRHMHGTADMVKLTKWINMIGGIFKFAKESKLADLEKEIYNLNTVSHYEQFFREVLANQIDYSPEYAHLLEEGCILAKYAIHSSKAPKKEKEAPTLLVGGGPNPADIDRWVRMQREAQAVIANRLRPRENTPRPQEILGAFAQARAEHWEQQINLDDWEPPRPVPQPAPAAVPLRADERRWPRVPIGVRSGVWARNRGFRATVPQRDNGTTTDAWNREYDAFVLNYREQARTAGFAV